MNTTFDRLHFDARSTCAATLNKSKTLVFIDANVDDWEYLAAGLYDRVEAYVLDSDRDGMDQITAIVKKQSDKIDAIHIVSHGSPGCLYLGNAVISQDTLKQYHSQLQLWKNVLSRKAELLLYGCCVAYARGSEFVKELSNLTGKAIAAAVDYTGNADGGGSWNLDYTTGTIAATPAFKPETMAGYGGLLATIIVTNINDSGPGSLREAIALAADGDTISIDPSLAGQTITLTSGQLEIDKDLIIDGANTTNELGEPSLTISGNNADRVIDVQTGSDWMNPPHLTLKNLIVADGKTTGLDGDGAGAGIRTTGRSTLTIDNSFFFNNHANGAGGGAIYAGWRSTNTIIDSSFSGNSSAGNGTEGKTERGGGAIAVKSESTTTVTGSTFTNNTGTNGGAINIVLGELTVENSTFVNNDSTPGGAFGPHTMGYGGAIYTDGASATTDASTSGTIRISNSLFDGNTGAGQGGGLFLFVYATDKVIVENSTIVNNSVIPDSKGDALGGGLRHGNGELTITNSTIANNTAQSQGGGLWVGETSPATITNSTFSGNRAESADGNDGLGGAIVLNNGSNPVNITNTTIANNYAGFQGGGFWSGGLSTTLTNTIVAYNEAHNGGNNWNINHHTGTQFSDGGGNIQSIEFNADDTLIAAGVTLADPKLGPLQTTNGSRFHPLLPGSPAIDAGVNAGAPATDQRGVTRGASIDIGAYEKSSHVRPDFNGDGKADILLRDSSGNNAIWLMDGTTQLSDSDIPFADNNLEVQGIIDFDGDGKSDILWRNSSTGENSIWLMDGPNRIGDNSIPSADSNWQVAATEDFNGDGKGDIFWRDPLTGENIIWLMDGSNRISNNSTGNAGSNWQVEGTGDFDGDSKADIIWRNSLTNVNTMWLMNGAAKIGDSPIGTTTWEVQSTGDFNGDGKYDILWRHSTGNNAIWLMDGTTRISGGSLPRVDTSWSVQGVSDFDADGKADILWRQNTGRNDIWLMDGINQIGGASIARATTEENLIL